MYKYLITTEYKLKFNANNIVQTKVVEWSDGSLRQYNKKSLKNLKNNKTKGIISKSSQVKLKRCINWLIISSKQKKVYSLKQCQAFKFKVNFITLTIPPQADGLVKEKDFKQLINTWLTYQRKYSGLNNYVWKVEKHKDNRLHIHILTDTFIHHKRVRYNWNLILLRAGLLEHHYSIHGNYNPPSTEIKSVKKVRNLAAYMVKYLCKSNDKDPLYNGRVWSCSSKLSKVNKNALYVTPDKMGEVVKPLMESMIPQIEVKTDPNALGSTFKVADIWLLKTTDWWRLKGSLIFDYFKELVLFLRQKNENTNQYELIYNL